jgi:hypothetical protein
MGNAQGVRIIAAIVGLVLGVLFIANVYREVFFGDASWWTLLLIIPALFIMMRLYNRWIKSPDEPPRPEQKPSRDDDPPKGDSSP